MATAPKKCHGVSVNCFRETIHHDTLLPLALSFRTGFIG